MSTITNTKHRRLIQELEATHEADCAEAYKAEAEELRKQLADREKQIVMLRGYLEQLACLGNGDQHGNSIGNDIAIKALNTTDDLSNCIICDAEPVGVTVVEYGTGVCAAWVKGGMKSGQPIYKARMK